jgi:oxaloacetate decarboxylase alpha subunit
MSTPLAITELVLRDGHQSLLATRLRIEDMLPICEKIDRVGLWSAEVWGGATFDACIRFLGEDPWERLRKFRKALPNTRIQMLLRGQNLLGYRHYADDVVDTFVEKAAENGMDVFRIFDALNDMRNIEGSVRATLKQGKHAQGALSYTVSPVHTMDTWIDIGKRLEDMGCHSVCIKDMAGLLKPYIAEEMVSRLKEVVDVPIAMQSHATTGMSTATTMKAVEAGLDMVDTSISSMSHTYGHSATESVVAILQGRERDTGLELSLLEDIASYFRVVRKKYNKFEGSLRGVDSRILLAQVPGGMLTNMENQLREQDAVDKFDDVLEEMPKVREDLGLIPLVTPTSQIVGTQSIVNILGGERYKTITKETAGILRGEYGKTPAPVNAELQKRALNGDDPVTCRPADLLDPEMQRLTHEIDRLAIDEGFARAEDPVEDVLTYALFAQVGLKFLKNRNNADAFEPPPWEQDGRTQPAPSETVVPIVDTASPARYRVIVNGKDYDVVVSPEGSVSSMQPAAPSHAPAPAPSAPPSTVGLGEAVPSPLSGTVTAVKIQPGLVVQAGEVILVLEAMKMETNVSAPRAGRIVSVAVQATSQVKKGDPLIYIA